MQDELARDMNAIEAKVGQFKAKLQMYAVRKRSLQLPLEKYEKCLNADKYALQELLRQEQQLRERNR